MINKKMVLHIRGRRIMYHPTPKAGYESLLERTFARPIREGLCYELAVKHILEFEEGTLVHGEVWSPNLSRMVNHAWVETETGYIYEPVSGEYFQKDAFYKTYKVREFKRYTVEEAFVMALKTKNYGPWEEEGGGTTAKITPPVTEASWNSMPAYQQAEIAKSVGLTPRSGTVYWKELLQSERDALSGPKAETVTSEVTNLTGDIWNRMTPVEREQLGVKAKLDAATRGGLWIDLFPEEKRALIREFKKEQLAIPKAEEEAGGGTMESYLVSGKCETVLEDLQAGRVPCYSFREVRRAAACLAWQKMESEKMPWGPSLKEAWQEVKQKCTWRE